MKSRFVNSLLWLILVALPASADPPPGWVQVGQGVTTVQNKGTDKSYTLQGGARELRATISIVLLGGLDVGTTGDLRYPKLTVKSNGNSLLEFRYGKDNLQFSPTIDARGTSISIQVSDPSIWKIEYTVFAKAPELPEVQLQER